MKSEEDLVDPGQSWDLESCTALFLVYTREKQ